MLRSIKVVAWFACQVLAGAAAGANAQAPESKGPVVKPLLNLDLAPEMDTVQGRAMRMQITIYELGAANKPHSHKDRPEIAYILSGKIIEHRGEVAKEFGPGDAFTADRNTTHWMENKGAVPAVMLVNGIAKKSSCKIRVGAMSEHEGAFGVLHEGAIPAEWWK
jgi:quercetin dioxygenase-like cupin family protein